MLECAFVQTIRAFALAVNVLQNEAYSSFAFLDITLGEIGRGRGGLKLLVTFCWCNFFYAVLEVITFCFQQIQYR